MHRHSQPGWIYVCCTSIIWHVRISLSFWHTQLHNHSLRAFCIARISKLNYFWLFALCTNLKAKISKTIYCICRHTRTTNNIIKNPPFYFRLVLNIFNHFTFMKHSREEGKKCFCHPKKCIRQMHARNAIKIYWWNKFKNYAARWTQKTVSVQNIVWSENWHQLFKIYWFHLLKLLR